MRTLSLGQFIPVKLVKSCDEFSSFIVTSGDDKANSNLAFLKAYNISHLAKTPEVLQKLKNSCLLGLEIDHPMVVKHIKAYKSIKCIFKLDQYVIGEKLSEELAKSRGFSENNIKQLVAQILLILEYLHSKKIVHRDLTPESIILTSRNLVYLEDIRNSKHIEGRTYTVVGNPYFASPEMLSTRGYGLEVDLWQLGVLAFILAYGRFPFLNLTDDPIDIFHSILEGEICFPKRASTSSTFGNFVKSLLKSNLESRIKTVKDAKEHAWLIGTPWNELQTHKQTGSEFSLPSMESSRSITSRLRETLLELSEGLISWSWEEDFVL
mmetsp:Transcript_33905/g.59098  ORF Transcript_33905/g.59098 Transcript_33905/m.59098 type:complete len:323 (-) Transcript_33905:14-982(-)